MKLLKFFRVSKSQRGRPVKEVQQHVVEVLHPLLLLPTFVMVGGTTFGRRNSESHNCFEEYWRVYMLFLKYYALWLLAFFTGK